MEEPKSAIAKAANIVRFEECPDYAIKALWAEWQLIRRRNPPDNMICTTAVSYQAFCQAAFEWNGCGTNFPSVFASYKMFQAEDDWSLNNCNYGWTPRTSARDWNKEDHNVYVAFVYVGWEAAGLEDAVRRVMMKAIAQHQEARKRLTGTL